MEEMVGKVDEERENALFYILESLGKFDVSSFLGRVVSFLEGKLRFSLPKIVEFFLEIAAWAMVF